ncbi:hypothetical protein JCM11641_008072 [Rhodosporidiobolus odoratus]
MFSSSRAPTVQLHPQAHRNPQPSSSSSQSPSPLSTTPFFPSLDSLLPAHASTSRIPTPRRTSSSSDTPTPRASPLQHSQPPSHGLADLDSSTYPLYSLAPNAPEIRSLTAPQYADLQDRYSHSRMSEKEMFPWAHGGADLPHSAAAQYFGFPRGKCAQAPSHRGLTTIYAPLPPAPSRSNSRSLLRRGFTASFASWTSSSASSEATSSASSSSGSPSPPPPATPTCRLVSAFEASTIITTSPSTGATSFALPAPSAFSTVNLRHFALQAAKYATISDVVIYGENGIDESVVDTAIKVREAMDHEWEKRGCTGVRYNVFIVSDPFTTFERDFPHLVSIDSLGFSRNRLNFFEREKEEMRVLTAASEIGENVWLGNTQDVPLAKTHNRPLSSDSQSSLLDDGNPYSFAVCVEAHDGSPLMAANTLALADGALNMLEAQGQAYDEVRRLLRDDNEYVEAKTTVLRPHVDDIIHLETLSTPTALGNSARAQTAFVNQLVDLACWIRDQSSPPPLTRGHHLPRRVLLHCGDGYTETSLIALAYVMVTRRIPAAEAYIFLQLNCERSFFVYPSDKETILKLERRVRDVLAREDEEEVATLRWHAEQQLVVAAATAARGSCAGEGESPVALCEATSSGMERSDSGFVDSINPDGTIVCGAYDEEVTTTLENTRKSIELELERELNRPRQRMRLSSPVTDAWFFGSTFEGHFPSKIMPFLYLGNLNHASNALMLKAIGITHVVSLGESALHTPRAPSGFSSLAAPFRASTSTGQIPENSLWLEERLGNISVLDMKNVADDGIDSIRPCIDEALAFIESARRQGGKILVHCKVGVSRSASIVIAYLMKELELDLASAYLLTRSRRLNILIQPNLPFMATLHAFENSLIEVKERRLAQSHQRQGSGNSRRSTGAESDASRYPQEDEDYDADVQMLGQAGLRRSNRLAFSFLCKEVAKLNERFLCWCSHSPSTYRIEYTPKRLCILFFSIPAHPFKATPVYRFHFASSTSFTSSVVNIHHPTASSFIQS